MIGKYIMLTILLGILYIALKMLDKLNLNFFKFVMGSLGIFTIAMIFFMDPLNNIISVFITKIMDFIATLTGGFEVYPQNSMLLIDTKDGMISMLINYECSGVIELLVYSSLVIFFPFVRKRKKIYALILGNLYITICNIIRLLMIILIVKSNGVSWYNISHTIIGRIVFFIMMVFLYYKVFTKSQLTNQKVGEIK